MVQPARNKNDSADVVPYLNPSNAEQELGIRNPLASLLGYSAVNSATFGSIASAQIR